MLTDRAAESLCGICERAGADGEAASVRQMDDGTVAARTPRRRQVPSLRAAALLLVVCLAALCAGSDLARLPSPDLYPVSLTDPAPPTNVIVTVKDRALDVDWTAPLEASIDSYRVYVDGVLAACPGGRSTTINNLVNGRSYVITVRTVTKVGSLFYEGTTASDPVSGTPRDTSAPNKPGGVAAVGGDRQVTVSWSVVTAYDVDGYRVFRNGVAVSGLISGGSTTSWTDTGLAADTPYSYFVQAHDTSGNWSADSSTATARTLDPYPPAAPTGLTAARGENRVTLTWATNTEPDLASYRVMRDGIEVATVPAGTTGYVDTGLTNDTTYAYTLVAVDTSNNRSAPSAPPVPATPTDLTAPAAPTGLALTPGNQRITVSWLANTEPDLGSYRVRRNGVVVATVPSGTSWTDTGLTNGTSYSYTVVAVDTHGNASPPSAAKSAIPRDPAPPINVVVTPKDRALDVDWTAPAEGNIDGYRVYLDGVLVASPGGRSTTISGLVNGRSYVVTVRTVVKVDNVLQEGERFSDPVTGIPRDTTPPPAPTGVTAVGGDRKATVSWTASGTSDADGYRVLRNGVPVTGLLSPVGTTSWTDTGLAAGAYTYTVQTHDTSGNWSNSSASAVATVVDNPPAAPTGLTAAPGDRRVTLSWTANTEPDLASYRVLRDGVEVATVTSGTSWTDTGLTNGTSYSYTLVAVDTAGNRSTPSAPPVSATPADVVAPAAPTGLAAAAGDGQVSLSWTANAEPDLASYRVLRDGVEVATVTSGTSWTDTGLTNGTSYSYTLVAVDTAGNRSTPSAAVSAVPAAVSTGVPAEGAGEKGGLAASSDGRFVVVGTRARLEASDVNSAYELYLVDRNAGTRQRIAPLPAGASGSTDPTNTAAPAISDDGRFVALATTARLVPADTNSLADVYRFDTVDRTWALVSVPPSGAVHASVPGTVLHTGSSVHASSPTVVISSDGDLVLFYSTRADLVAGDTNGAVDVFAKRMSTGEVTRVSATAAGGNLPRTAIGPALALTPDGRFALFPAAASVGPVVLYRKTLLGAGAGDVVVVSRVTVGPTTTEFAVFRDAGDVAVSDDGRYVALVTTAKVDTATPGANYSAGLAYRVDVDSGAVLAMGSGQRTVWEHRVELDPSGRYGFFATAAPALAGDGNGHTDIYRRDLAGGAQGPLVLVTADAGGAHTYGPIGSVTPAEYTRVFATTGDRVLMTTSQALLAADGNRLRDVYSKDVAGGSVGSPLG